ncbi:MAG TPA: hypothetical protein VF145_11315 [Chitinophagaceae bacterium]
MKLSRFLTAIIIFLLAAGSANAQFQVEWKVLTNEGTGSAKVSNFASVGQARNIIDEIISIMNLRVNFEVREANVPNAGAVFYNHKRYILYNPNFIRQIDRATGTDWASVSILAHEIGHHVKGHVFESNGGSSHRNELEADEFSGMVLRKMGASLEDAQIAMRLISADRASATHPGKADRLMAIAKGWNAAVPADVARSESRQGSSTRTTSTAVTLGREAEQQYSRSAVLADEDILVEVNFTVDKKNEYFITVNKNLVKWDGSRLTLIGKLAKLRNENYPFYIYDSQKNYVFVAKTGYLVNDKGKNVGYLSMHTGAATAAR